jgi:DNA-binding NarL/FixJ family response regulator
VSYPIRIHVYAPDPLSRSGVIAELEHTADVVVTAEAERADITVVVVDEVDEDAARVIRAAQRGEAGRVVVVVTRIDDRGLLAAVEAGACGVVRRADATPTALADAVAAAANGDGTLPTDLLGRLLRQVSRLQRQVLAPRGLGFHGLSQREIDVLRLVADGYDTGEIATRLAYSERTIKNVIHDVTSRLQLRNRSQAVAYAVREGLI